MSAPGLTAVGPNGTPGVPFCPSARAGMAGAVVFGVAGEGPEGLLGYLDRLVPATPEVLALAGPADPADVFRLAAPCAGGGCRHFADDQCTLAARVAGMLPAAADGTPPCRLRPVCRWWRQEGRAACLRCPQIVSGRSAPSELMVLVADPSTPAPNPR